MLLTKKITRSDGRVKSIVMLHCSRVIEMVISEGTGWLPVNYACPVHDAHTLPDDCFGAFEAVPDSGSQEAETILHRL